MLVVDHLPQTLSMVKATLGGEIEVPVLDGTVKYSIPEGTQPDTVFRLKGKGIKMLNKERYGDLYVRTKVEIPKKLSEKQTSERIPYSPPVRCSFPGAISTKSPASTEKMVSSTKYSRLPASR